MAKVIKGAFPQTSNAVSKKNDKPVPSYILHISIAFSDPLVWRRIQVPGTFTLSQLHQVIQRSMGWSDSHVHQFLVGKISYEPTQKSNKPRESKRFDENNYTLHALEDGMQFMFTYLYDAGEGWEHLITLEEVIPPTIELKHPILISGEMACPPETVGDVHIYNDLTLAMESADHKDRNSLAELSENSNFDPTYFDVETAKTRVNQLKDSLS